VIVLGLVFAPNYVSFENVILIGLGFITLCFISSANYIRNDISDIECDKQHPAKKNRPLPSGTLSIKQAYVMFIILIIIGLTLGFSLSINFGLMVLALFLISEAYTRWLKRIIILDVFTLGINFIIRAVSGIVWVSMTINTWNCDEVIQVAEYWKDLAESINFQFHTPFVENDPLWVPYGKKRDIINEIISLKRKYPEYVINEIKQLEIVKSPWGGDKSGPTNCPNWAIMAIDHNAEKKMPCCIGGAKEDDMKPMCENCGLSNYSSLFVRGIHL